MAVSKQTGLKTIQPYVKVAGDFKKKDLVTAYYCNLYAMESGMRAKDDPSVKSFLMGLINSLEEQKKALELDRNAKEIMSSPIVAITHIEDQARNLFNWADAKDRNSEFNKKVVRAFYTSALLFDVAEGVSKDEDIDEESKHQRKYARWKATYIHNCLKNGEIPEPGPVGGLEDSWNDDDGATGVAPSVSPASYQDQTRDLGPGHVSEPPKPVARSRPADPPQPAPSTYQEPAASYDTPTSPGADLNPMVFNQAQKLSKYATSAIMCQDVPTALLYLEKCMNLLKTGKEDP